MESREEGPEPEQGRRAGEAEVDAEEGGIKEQDRLCGAGPFLCEIVKYLLYLHATGRQFFDKVNECILGILG